VPIAAENTSRLLPLALDTVRIQGIQTQLEAPMAEGTIKRLTDKGFGFIDNGTGKDLFFHMSAVEGCRFEDLREGQKVTYNEGRGAKGPRAENVRVI
jgi:CspA family cold shock protein